MASRINKSVPYLLTGSALFGALLTTTVAAPQKMAPGKKPSAAIAAGKIVYDQNKCGSCHMIAGKGGKAGPDLSAEGSNAKHTPQWLEAEIKNPKSHKPDSKMPAYEEKIKGKDLSDLVAYLRSLKKK